MSRAIRAAAWLVLVGTALMVGAQSAPRLDALVLRNGFVSLPYTAADTGVNNSGLRLTAMGRVRDARGAERYTVWRVRNANASARSVRVLSADGVLDIAFSAAADSETYLRSQSIAGTAEHGLWVNDTVLTSAIANAQDFVDATLVSASAGANNTPVFTTLPPTVAEVGQTFRYAPLVRDDNRDLLQFSTLSAPSGFAYDNTDQAYEFNASAAQIGQHSFTLRASDGRGGTVDQTCPLRVVGDFCPVYPIALPSALFAGATYGQVFNEVPRGNGNGAYSWLSWNGDNSSPAVAESLRAPGNSYLYTNPDNASDHQLDIGDWAQGSPGNNGSSAVRDALDALLQKPIVVPLWSTTRGSGSHFDYRVAQFARIKLTAYRLGGNGYFSFVFLGYANCYNDAPVANDQSVQVTKNTPKPITLTATDPENNTLTYRVVRLPEHGTLSGTALNLTYTPDTGYVGPDSFTFVVNDGEFDSEPGLVSITVVGLSNTAPTATAQSRTLAEDSTLNLVLQGSDAENQPLSFAVLTQPAHGVLSGAAPNLSYTPAPNFHGQDSFTFKVNDGELDSAPATVQLAVTPVNDVPVAETLTRTTPEDSALTITLAAVDNDGDPLSYTIVEMPQHGLLTGTAPNLTYVPFSNYFGPDSFIYRVSDGTDTSNGAVYITVTPVNDLPVGDEQNLGVEEDGALTILLTGSDVDGDTISFALADAPTHGTLSGTAPELVYTPNADYNGNDSFTFTVYDGALTSTATTVAIAVAPVNDAPIAYALDVDTQENQAVSFTVDGSDIDGDTISFRVVEQPSNGTVSGNTATLTYTPNPGFFGADSLRFVVYDGTVDSAPAAVRISVAAVNETPIAQAQQLSIAQGGTLTIALAATDGDGDALTYRVENAPTHGTLTGAAPDLNYTPAAGYTGADAFTFVANDGAVDSAPATIAITVTSVNTNTAPVANDFEIEIDGCDNNNEFDASDAENDALSYRIVDAPAHGTVVLLGDAQFSYYAAGGYTGDDEFTYVANDGELDSNPATVSVSIIEGSCAPIAENQALGTNEDQSLPLVLSASDRNGDALFYEIVAVPTHGTLSGSGANRTYTPAPNFFGVDTFTYRASDGSQQSNTATVSIDILPINDAPSATPQSLQTQEDGALSIVLGGADIDGNALSFRVVEQPEHGTLSGSAPNLNYTPAPNYFGPDSFRFVTNDGSVDSASALIAIAVTAVNDAPTITTVPLTTATAFAEYRYEVDASDIENDTLLFSLTQSPAGAVIDAQTGSITWQPAANQGGSATFTVVVTDTHGAQDTQTFEVQVDVPNRAPVFTSVAANRANPSVTYTYDADATDPDGDAVTYDLAEAPTGMTIDAGSGIVAWLPSATDLGSHSVVVVARDARGAETTQSYSLVVSQTQNRAPEITSIPVTEVSAESVYAYDVDAIDPDADELRYRLDVSPAGASINSLNGLVSWSPSTTVANGSALSNTQCRRPSAVSGPLAATVKWHWNTEKTLTAPLIVPLHDTNGNGGIDTNDSRVVLVTTHDDFVDNDSGVIRALDAKTGTLLWTQQSGTTPLRASSQLAAADIDRDGRVEIFGFGYAGAQRDELVAFNDQGQQLWVTNGLSETGQYNYGAPHVADIDGDGTAEIIVRNAVVNANGSIRWQRPEFVYHRITAFAADITSSPGQEVIVGRYIYSAAGDLLFELPLRLSTLSAVGNFDADASAEIVAVEIGNGGLTVNLFQHDGARIWGPVVAPGDSGGPPTIADFDGDGAAEIGVSSYTRYTVIDTNGAILWSRPIDDPTSGTTGSTLFDFDADGVAEVLIPDEVNMHVFDGRKGKTRLVWPNRSWTGTEFPVVADVDGDGAAEIVVVSDRDADIGVKVLEAAQGHWLGTRALWNQYDYTISNINDDMTVPRTPVPSWQTHNTYRLNAYPDRDPLGMADLAVHDVSWSEGDPQHVSARIWNRGLAPTSGTARAALFVGEPGSSAAAIAEIDIPVLAADESAVLTFPWSGAAAPSDTLSVVVDTHNAITECIENNNDAYATVFQVAAADPFGAADTQRYSVSVNMANHAPTLGSVALADARSLHVYDQAVQANDADKGDAIAFTLVGAPAGMRIESPSGRILWYPQPTQVGLHAFTVRATDLAGLSAEREVQIRVLANTPPTFTSAPPNYAEVMRGQVFEFDFDAIDADGDELSYAAVVNVLPGLTVNAATGLARWSAWSFLGPQTITVEVDDASGGKARQSITVNVVTTTENHPPAFTTQPVISATAGVGYAYTAIAADPDGDNLSYTLVAGPQGMLATRNQQGYRLTWTPSAAQVGTHSVSIRVSDGRGATVDQNFTIRVYGAGGNTAPSITSSPGFDAKATFEYRYDVDATDADGDTLVYSLIAAPTGMSIDANTGLIRWTPVAPGSAAVTVRVADPQAYVEQSWNIAVNPASAVLTATLSATPTSVAPGGEVVLSLQYSGAAGPVTRTLTVDGNTVTLDAAGEARFTSSVIGRHQAQGVVSDPYGNANASTEFYVSDPSDTDAPVVELLSPTDNAEVTAPSSVRATVTDANLASWILVTRPSNSPGAQATTLAQGSNTFTNLAIAEFDPTLLINGQYSLILQATDTSGRVSSDSVVLRVTDDMKVGHFSLTFEDVSIPVAGIPVRVTRTYDTRQRSEDLDFGYGWSVDYQNVRIRESAPLGLEWRIEVQQNGLFPEYCVRSNGNRVVTITLPDGEVETFHAKVTPECSLAPEPTVSVVFEGVDDTHSTLTQHSYGVVRVATVAGSSTYNLVDPDALTTPIDPSLYTLTTPEGLAFELEQGFGIRKVTDLNGQTLTYSNAGIVHSSGLSVNFVRDGQGRITDMVLPDGEIISYTYTANGDLLAKADEVSQITQFAYEPRFAHYLKDIIDPRGVRVTRNEYDDDGRLIATIDADGHRIEMTHDINGRIEQVRDRRGNLQTFVYDDSGRVLSETNALGETTLHTYDGDGNELSRTDHLGHSTSWTYDARNNALTETNHLGETTSSTFDARNSLLTQTDARGVAIMTNTYNPNNGELLSTTDAEGNTTSFSYDSGIGTGGTGELLRITDAASNQTRYDIDVPYGYRLRETDALGHITHFSNDSMGRVLSETRTQTVGGVSTPTALVTSYTYDAKGRVTRINLPDGGFSTTEYNAIDKPVRECDSANRCTVTTYDNRGYVSRIDYADGTFETKAYDPNGNTIAETDRAGRVTKMVYDAADRLVETIHPDATPNTDADNPRTRNEYDGAGRMTASIDERGNRTEYTYDAANRRTQVIQAAVSVIVGGNVGGGSVGGAGAPTVVSPTTTTTYDIAGRRTAVTDAEGRTTSFVYDDAGRLLETHHHDGTVTKSEYDELGRKTADIAPSGKRSEYQYDALGRLTTVTLGNVVGGASAPTITTYTYDEQGNKLTQTDAAGRITRFAYDRQGREVSRTLPLGQSESKQYNLQGELTTATDFAGKLMGYAYDAVGRITGIDYQNDADVAYTYTQTGQRATATDGRGTTSWTYDARDRLTRKTDPDGKAIEYQYDAAGNLIARITANQSQVYGYDALNRMSTHTATRQGEPARNTAYVYDAVGNLKRMTSADGGRTDYDYDQRNRLIQLTKRDANNNIVFAASYTLNDDGLRTAVQESDEQGAYRSIVYTYDQLNRLTQEAIDHRDNANDRVTAWTYDSVGNRQTQSVTLGGTVGGASAPTITTYTYDANDRLLSESVVGGSGSVGGAGAPTTTLYTHDANGNTTGKSAPGVLIAYDYDDANRLKEMRENGERTTYEYNVDGIRVAQTKFPAAGSAGGGGSGGGGSVGGALAPTKTTYLIDTNFDYAQVAEEYTQVGTEPETLSAAYAYGHAVLSQTRYTPAVGGASAPTTRFIHADGFGSTRYLTDATGTKTDRIDYDAFGNEIARTGTTAVEHLYRGEQFDPNLGWYNLRARYYDPSIGRFATMDTFRGFSSDPRSLHKYMYGNADPINGRDPSGNLTLGEALTGLAVAGVLYASAEAAVLAGRGGEGRDPRSHYYEVEGKICDKVGAGSRANDCTPNVVFEIMRHCAAPRLGMNCRNEPVNTGDEAYAHDWLPGGLVRFEVNPAAYKIVNITTLLHTLYKGQITRWAEDRGDSIWIRTVGDGSNFTPMLAALNETYGKRVFEGLDQDVRYAWYYGMFPTSF